MESAHCSVDELTFVEVFLFFFATYRIFPYSSSLQLCGVDIAMILICGGLNDLPKFMGIVNA